MPDPKSANSAQLIGIQYLRAVAALMVAYFHASSLIPQFEGLLNRYLLGGLHLSNGVDLFFVISGFIMVLTGSNAAPREFAMRRIIRIVPLYWTLTGTLMLLALWRPEAFRATAVSFEYFVKSLLFIPYPNPGQDGQLFPLLVPGWSLNLEMFFYAVFTVVLYLPRHRRVAVAGLTFVIAACGAALLRHSTFPYAREIRFFGDLRMFEFLFGMIIAEWYSKGLPRLPVALNWAIAAGAFTVLFWGLPFLQLSPRSIQQQFLENGLPAALIVLVAVSLEPGLQRRPLRWLAYLGDASYSMYLGHLFCLGIARLLWTRAGLVRDSLEDAIGFAIFGIGLTIVGTIVIYRGLELPMLHFFQRAYRRRRAPT
jgi:exopolysaccharide production protein ExoZ